VATTFAHTLSSIVAPKTAMYVSVTDGNETLVDDRNGNMVGNMGGTGTVNYGTGASQANQVLLSNADGTWSATTSFCNFAGQLVVSCYSGGVGPVKLQAPYFTKVKLAT
jgi:hypothetical protein